MSHERSRVDRLADAVPTSGDDWRLLGRTLKEVLGTPVYGLLAALVGGLALTLFVVSQNVGLVRDIVVFGTLPLTDRLSFLWDLYPLVGPAYTLDHALLLLAVAVLVGVNVAMLGYQLVTLDLVAREGAGGAAGVVLGTLGAGCAACGTAILAPLLSLFGVTGALTVLPYEGKEFLLLAIVVMLLSAYRIAEAIAGDAACPVDLN